MKWVLKLSISSSIILGPNWENLKHIELQPNLAVFSWKNIVYSFSFIVLECVVLTVLVNLFDNNKENSCPHYIAKLSNENDRTRCKTSLKLTIKAVEWPQWYCSVVFLLHFEHISYLVLVVLLLTLSMQCQLGLYRSFFFQNKMCAL